MPIPHAYKTHARLVSDFEKEVKLDQELEEALKPNRHRLAELGRLIEIEREHMRKKRELIDNKRPGKRWKV